MRFNSPKPESFDRRTITKFLYFPKCINNEWRWLETASLVQIYINRNLASDGWYNIKWKG